MKIRRKLLISIGGLILAVMIGIQFVPVQRDNPPARKEPPWDTPRTRTLAARACFDCHSNETRWPWYSRIAPVTWMIAEHVTTGRSRLNFSEWPTGDLADAVEEIEGGQMPLPEYLWLHPEARLTAEEKEALIAGLTATDENLFTSTIGETSSMKPEATQE